MDIYVAELDEQNRVAAVWVSRKEGRSPRVFDPDKHVFDVRPSNEYSGAPREDIMKWMAAQEKSTPPERP